jgi:hypothetical protein
MSAVAFDTLKLARTLRDTAHMTQEQAEGISNALAEAMSGAELATKHDLADVRTELKADIHLMERDLKIWFGKMMAWQLTAIAALLAIATAAIKLL